MTRSSVTSSTIFLPRRSRVNRKITEYPVAVETYEKKVAVVGISTRGIKVAYELSQQCKQIGNFTYVTCDLGDVGSISSGRKIVFDVAREYEKNPFRLRGLVSPQLYRIREALQGAQLTFIVVGLGGAVGSGLAPIVARCAKKELHSMTVAIISMPYNFEKSKYFFAGCALRQLKAYCDGILLLENDEVFEPKLSVIDAYARTNERISLALNEMLEPVEIDGSSSGIENVVDYVKANPYAILKPIQSSRDGYPNNNNNNNNELEENTSMLVGYESLDDIEDLISYYDPVDATLRSGNLDSGADGEGFGFLSSIQNIEFDCD